LKKAQKISEDLNLQTLFIGIVAYEKIHKISWAINEKLNIKLKINQDETSETFEYSEDANYKLIANKVNTVFFIKEIKNIDFILKIIGYNLNTDKLEIIKKIKSINFVTGVFEIDIDKYKKSKKILLNF